MNGGASSRTSERLSRRTFGMIAGGVAAELAIPGSLANTLNPQAPPQLPSGVASGDVTASTAIVWSRCDRPAGMYVEYGSDAELRHARTVGPFPAGPDTDHCAKARLADLPAGTKLYYRVWFQDERGRMSAPLTGSFRTAPPPGAKANLFFAWSGDVAGQGFGINPGFGGMKIFESIRRLQPDFFLHSGDHVYADVPIPESIPLQDGTVWHNVVTPAKSRVASALDDFRGNFAYNLLDENVRRFQAEVPLIVQWDDHETTNNWYPDQVLANRSDAAAYAGVPSGRELAARARQAFFEYMPIDAHPEERERIYRSFRFGDSLELFVLDQRSYRGPNSPNVAASGTETTFLGQKQLQWLKEGLTRSHAVWKVIASDMPIGLIVNDGLERQPHFEGVANAKPGEPSGRELEISELLTALKTAGVRNVVWLTADVHYACAQHYSPERAGSKQPFEPFWEFVAGPLHAGTFGPGKLDPTFGPETRFEWAPRAGMTLPTGRQLPADFKRPLPPSDGMQSFGTVRVDGVTGLLTVEFRDHAGELIHSGGRPGRFELQPI